MSLVQRFERNLDGRDFVVGDIHGCFDALRALMARVSFDEARDRMFSVGDLVDRGPKSHEAAQWIGKSWFHAVCGNHERMAIDCAAGIQPRDNYRDNGGAWFLDLPECDRTAFAQVFDDLPLVIEVETEDGAIGIVHADPVFNDWAELVRRIGEPLVQRCAVWSRERYKGADCTRVENINAVIVGHCVVPHPLRHGNVFYIDTGAYKGRALTMIELGEMPTVHVESMAVAA
jgi:serine/threonine protein phosphatase 1